MAVKVKNKKKSGSKKPTTIMGKELVSACPCGVTVEPWDRQDIVYNEEKDVFHRVCKECIEGGCHFDDTKGMKLADAS